MTPKNKLSRFERNGGIERMNFVSGTGEPIQSGGYSVSGNSSNQLGIDLSKVLFGTRNNFGIPFEAVLNLENVDQEAVAQTKNDDQRCILDLNETFAHVLALPDPSIIQKVTSDDITYQSTLHLP